MNNSCFKASEGVHLFVAFETVQLTLGIHMCIHETRKREATVAD